MQDQDIRWKQRFYNFDKAFTLLKNAINVQNPDLNDRAAIVKFFEMSFELAWKLLKDYQELEQSFILKGPRDTIKNAFQYEIIDNARTWLNALEDRNLTVHVYEERTAKKMDQKIRHDYFAILENLHKNFKEKVKK